MHYHTVTTTASNTSGLGLASSLAVATNTISVTDRFNPLMVDLLLRGYELDILTGLPVKWPS